MNDYFCVLPFFGYEYYSAGGSHCCLLPKDYDINTIRNDMLNGVRTDACQACWNLEDSGLPSDRHLKNAAFDYYWDRDIRYIEEDARQGNFKPLLIKYSTSNKCNATCVTCGPGASSSWAKLNKVINIKPDSDSLMNQTYRDLNFRELVGLTLLGGEPLYEKHNFYILEKLIENHNDKCFIQITTNGSVILSEEHKKLLNKFKNISIGLSIDGVGPVFEYMRYPLKWKKLLENLEFFRTLTDNISANYCISNINVLYHQQTIDWFKSQNMPFHYNPVINPAYFASTSLPLSVKQKILSQFRDSKDLKHLLGNPHTSQDDTNFELAMKEITRQDGLKKINIADYLPELCDLIK